MDVTVTFELGIINTITHPVLPCFIIVPVVTFCWLSVRLTSTESLVASTFMTTRDPSGYETEMSCCAETSCTQVSVLGFKILVRDCELFTVYIELFPLSDFGTLTIIEA